MGHEPAGVVESIGEQVTDLEPGDRVIPYIFLIPSDSPWYGADREQLCPEMTGVIGIKGHGGGYAEKLVLPAQQLLRVPEAVALPDAAVHCDAGVTAYHAVRRSRLAAGETALVIGVGGVGSFAIQFATLVGAHAIAAERTEAKLKWACTLGASEAVDSSRIVEAVGDLTGGRGVDCVLDIVGTEATMAIGLGVLAAGGRIVVVGYTPDSFALSGKRLAQSEIEIIGSRCGSRKELTAALDLTASGKVRSIITNHEPLGRVNEALAKLRRGEVLGRLVLDVAPSAV
jgi:propanol-preferring alcohol dehydrogenase